MRFMKTDSLLFVLITILGFPSFINSQQGLLSEQIKVIKQYDW